MKFVIYTNSLSAHQIPLAKEIAKQVGAENFQYVYTSRNGQALQECVASDDWICYAPTGADLAARHDVNDWLENADVMLVGGIRPFDLIERRVKSGKKTLYMSERWFKPNLGILRLAWPPYFRMAKRFAKMLRRYDSLVYLPIGIHAARDMVRLCGLMHGDLRCLFRAPRLDFENCPMGRVWLRQSRRVVEASSVDCRLSSVPDKHCLDKMRMWGYFVKSSEFGVKSSELNKGSLDQTHNSELITHNSLRVLWVGRLLRLKRVDTIIRAVGYLASQASQASQTSQTPQTSQTTQTSQTPQTSQTSQTSQTILLDIYGAGPEEERLKKMAAKYGDIIKFHPPVPIAEVRKLMRNHDLYVFASNGYEGWGAVVSEALEEGMKVIGTYEAGASATMLPETNLFCSGDWKMLVKRLSSDIPCVPIGDWSVKRAAEQLMKVI